MRKSRGTSKGQFKRLFEQEASEDHEVVSVSKLGLHYHRRLQACLVHEKDVVWFPQFIVRIVELELLLPECVDKIALEIIGSVLDESSLIALFSDFGVALAESE